MTRRTIRARSRAANRRVTLVTRTVLLSMTGVTERQLALWEREELVAPVRFEGPARASGGKLRGRREPLYSAAAMRRVRVIRTLAEELEVNLPGIEVILRLLDQMAR